MRKSDVIRQSVENKRFVRRPEGARITSLGLQMFDKMATEAGAKIKVGKVALYDIELTCEYLKTFAN